MKDLTRVIPESGEVLRILVRLTGYRPYFENIGGDKDLDDMSNGSRPGSNFTLFQYSQNTWLRALQEDCGIEWHNLVSSYFQQHIKKLQILSRGVDTTGLISSKAKVVLQRSVVTPGISGFIRRASNETQFNIPVSWWNQPFATWLNIVSDYSDLSGAQLVERLESHLEVDARTLERWRQGGTIGASLWPYRHAVQAMLIDTHLDKKRIEQLTGWLVISVALQSISEKLRADIAKYFQATDVNSLKSDKEVIMSMMQEAADRRCLDLRYQIKALFDEIEQLFSSPCKNERDIRIRLDWLRAAYEKYGTDQVIAYEYLWLWLSARLEAHLGHEVLASRQYGEACEQAWGRAGPNQCILIHEALCYSVGMGKKVKAEHYWDKAYLLGLNELPKKPLDEQEMRRLSFEFERRFSPQKSKSRIPPAVRTIVNDSPFSITSKDLLNPNRKRAVANGRIRYTPLMDAVMQGSLADVKKMIAAGGCPNVFIPESGDNALIISLRRAYDSGNSDILKYILSLDLTPDTVNRPASTKRETPLKIALEMADLTIVERLIVLGANIENPCFTSPSALVYAMALLHQSLPSGKVLHSQDYYSGRVPGDAFDAKGGAILDSELQGVRQARRFMIDEVWKNNVIEALRKHYDRPVAARKEVIMTLLKNGANPNQRYKAANDGKSRWTPMLFAAQLGDLEIVKVMIDSGGDPWASLEEASPGNEKNALWIAIKNHQHVVVKHLEGLRHQPKP